MRKKYHGEFASCKGVNISSCHCLVIRLRCGVPYQFERSYAKGVHEDIEILVNVLVTNVPEALVNNPLNLDNFPHTLDNHSQYLFLLECVHVVVVYLS